MRIYNSDGELTGAKRKGRRIKVAGSLGDSLGRHHLTLIAYVVHDQSGSEPEMCGNGIRCLAKFLRQLEGECVNESVS